MLSYFLFLREFCLPISLGFTRSRPGNSSLPGSGHPLPSPGSDFTSWFGASRGPKPLFCTCHLRWACCLSSTVIPAARCPGSMSGVNFPVTGGVREFGLGSGSRDGWRTAWAESLFLRENMKGELKVDREVEWGKLLGLCMRVPYINWKNTFFYCTQAGSSTSSIDFDSDRSITHEIRTDNLFKKKDRRPFSICLLIVHTDIQDRNFDPNSSLPIFIESGENNERWEGEVGPWYSST